MDISLYDLFENQTVFNTSTENGYKRLDSTCKISRAKAKKRSTSHIAT